MAHMKFGTHEVEGLNIQFDGQVSRANAVEQHPEVGFFEDVSVTLAVSEKTRNMGPPLASNQCISLEPKNISQPFRTMQKGKPDKTTASRGEVVRAYHLRLYGANIAYNVINKRVLLAHPHPCLVRTLVSVQDGCHFHLPCRYVEVTGINLCSSSLCCVVCWMLGLIHWPRFLGWPFYLHLAAGGGDFVKGGFPRVARRPRTCGEFKHQPNQMVIGVMFSHGTAMTQVLRCLDRSTT